MLLRAATTILLLTCATACAQSTPTQRYADAHRRLRTHTGDADNFLHDDSPEAIVAIHDLWSSVAAFLIDLRQHQPKISVGALDHAVCILTTEAIPPNNPDGYTPQTVEEQCAPALDSRPAIIQIAAHLLLVTPSVDGMGTVFLLDDRIAKPAILWSIADTTPSPLDHDHLIAAWKPEHSGDRCRYRHGRAHYPCGPLAGSPTLLSEDDAGNPRFAIDSTFSRGMGGTGETVASIWQWDGHHATLQWIAAHNTMLDDPRSTFDGYETFTVHFKGERHTFGDCGSCDSAPQIHQVLIEPSRVRDRGTMSLAPELDLVDALFWRIHHHLPTAQIAAPAVIAAITPQIRQAEVESAKAQGKGIFYIGMIMSSFVQRTPTGASVCLVLDGIDDNTFTLRRQANGGYFIASAQQAQLSDGSCQEYATKLPPSPLPPPP
jgi:hypothetical protein